MQAAPPTLRCCRLHFYETEVNCSSKQPCALTLESHDRGGDAKVFWRHVTKDWFRSAVALCDATCSYAAARGIAVRLEEDGRCMVFARKLDHVDTYG